MVKVTTEDIVILEIDMRYILGTLCQGPEGGVVVTGAQASCTALIAHRLLRVMSPNPDCITPLWGGIGVLPNHIGPSVYMYIYIIVMGYGRPA